jgi:hypothetical protein
MQPMKGRRAIGRHASHHAISKRMHGRRERQVTRHNCWQGLSRACNCEEGARQVKHEVREHDLRRARGARCMAPQRRRPA